MSECRVVPCYKMFLKELKEIVATNPVNISLNTSSCIGIGIGGGGGGSGMNTSDTSPEVDVEHITIKHHHHYPVSSTVVEAVNRGIQTNMRPEARSHSASLSGGSSRDMMTNCSALLNPKLLNRQVVSQQQSIHSEWRAGDAYNSFYFLIYLFSIYLITMVGINILRKSVRLD